MNATANLIDFILTNAGGVISKFGTDKNADTHELRAAQGMRYHYGDIKKTLNGNRQYAKSIRGRADSFIMQYPLVVSDTISPDTVEILRNNIELERATELGLVLNNMPIQTYEPADAYHGDFLGNLHTNISLNDSTEKIWERDILETNQELLETEDSKFEVRSINENTIPKDYLLMLNENKEETEEEKEAREAKLRGNLSAATIVGDITKLNRTIPLMIETEILYRVFPMDEYGTPITSADSELIKTKIKFGIKAVNHLVKHEDVIFFLGDSARNSNLLTKLVKLTTGELSLVKDILFNKERAKRTAISTKKNNKVWKNLNLLSTIQRANDFQTNYNQLAKDSALIPTTTLAIGIDEVNAIINITGRDLLNDAKFAMKTYSDLFLLDLIVVDEANNYIYKFEPAPKTFVQYPLSAFEEVRIPKRQGKDVPLTNIMDKMRKRSIGI